MRLNSVYLMLIRKKVYFNQKLTHPYYSSGNPPNTITLNYSVEYLTRIMFYESVQGVSHIPYVEDFAHFGQKSNSKSRWSLSKGKRNEAHCRFCVAGILPVSIKTKPYSYFSGNNKSPAILLTLLVLALLLQIRSTIGRVVIHDSRKR